LLLYHYYQKCQHIYHLFLILLNIYTRHQYQKIYHMSIAIFTASGTFTGTPNRIQAWGAGGAGSIYGNGGSGGAYSETGSSPNDTYAIVVGTGSFSDGQDTTITNSSVVTIVVAPGGTINGNIDHQTGSIVGISGSYGGLGGANNGYANYNGGGGGSGAGVHYNGADGKSAHFATTVSGALGGQVGTDTGFSSGSAAISGSGPGGNGAFYFAGATEPNTVLPASSGSYPGGGGGGNYFWGVSPEWPTPPFSEWELRRIGQGANGLVIVTY
jgi:hypothetical protein